jgi:folate-binding protein YgfZ
MPATLQPETASVTTQLDALLHHAAIAPLSDIGWIAVTGADRVRWLNGMVTNSIQSLAPGEGNYNFALNAQGRIQADLTAFALEDQILLETTEAGKLATHLDHFIIMDDVELADITRERHGILIAGPDALRVVQELGGAPCSAPQLATKLPTKISLKQTAYRGAPVHLIHAHSPLVPRFEVWADRETISQIFTELASIPKATPEALEHLRLLSGTPRYGIDIRNTEKSRDLPQETNQPHALNFTKGCYLGQEIVERIHSRGAVHRTLTGLLLTGALPIPGTAIEAASDPTATPKPVGEITSAALIPLPTGPIQLALAYLRRDALAEAQAHKLALTYPGGTATPIPLPYPLLSKLSS